jgi:hypothetical protein
MEKIENTWIFQDQKLALGKQKAGNHWSPHQARFYLVRIIFWPLANLLLPPTYEKDFAICPPQAYPTKK